MATDPNNASSKPKVKVGTEIVMCLRNTQRFSSYLFNIFHKDLRREDLEFRFGLNFIKEDDTPNRIGLQTNDTIWVRKCRNPSSKKQSSNIMFEVKVCLSSPVLCSAGMANRKECCTVFLPSPF